MDKVNVEHRYKPEDSDVSIIAEVTDDVYSNKFNYELLWAKSLGKNKAILLSIPFLCYGLNPGDTVELNSKGKIIKLVNDGGFCTYRILLPNLGHEEHVKLHNTIYSLLMEKGFKYEVMSVKLIGIAAENNKRAVELEELISKMKNDGYVLNFDTSR